MMMFRLFAAALAAAGLGMLAETIPPAGQLVAHEWGTFTSVADSTGSPAYWLALGGPVPLPCFVHAPVPEAKFAAFATVRMETPVIYFYTPRRTKVSVGVRFWNGRFTEWYPQATESGGGNLQWKGVSLLPGEDLTFPQGEQPNHYYAARATDSAPLRIGDEQEKLIFYRGVADLNVPVRPRFLSTGRVELRQEGSEPVPSVILFENREDRMGFRTVGTLQGKVEVDEPELTAAGSDAIRSRLKELLIGAGLYPKEAAAMLATWRESWFEEGTRVFYIAPRAMVDRVLPLTIDPAPAALARVFVGRVELMSPSTEKEVLAALGEADTATLSKHNRFLYAWWNDLKQRGLIAKWVDLSGLTVYKQPECAR